MSTIIAGEFETLGDAEIALKALRVAGVRDEDYCTFAINPPGQHDQYPIGGDRDESPGAKNAEGGSATGAVVGAAVGGTVGAVGGPVGAAVGAGVGAYAGSFVGAMGGMDTSVKTGSAVRKAGVLVAVNAATAKPSADAIAHLLNETGAQPVERTEGVWSDGEWKDFNPVRRPQPLFPVN